MNTKGARSRRILNGGSRSVEGGRRRIVGLRASAASTGPSLVVPTMLVAMLAPAASAALWSCAVMPDGVPADRVESATEEVFSTDDGGGAPGGAAADAAGAANAAGAADATGAAATAGGEPGDGERAASAADGEPAPVVRHAVPPAPASQGTVVSFAAWQGSLAEPLPATLDPARQQRQPPAASQEEEERPAVTSIEFLSAPSPGRMVYVGRLPEPIQKNHLRTEARTAFSAGRGGAVEPQDEPSTGPTGAAAAGTERAGTERAAGPEGPPAPTNELGAGRTGQTASRSESAAVRDGPASPGTASAGPDADDSVVETSRTAGVSRAVPQPARVESTPPPDARTTETPRETAQSLPVVAAASRASRSEPSPAGSSTSHSASSDLRASVDQVVHVQPGEPISVVLNGLGWVFSGPWDQYGVEFVRREIDSDNTSFTFKAVEAGDFRLEFRRQDAVRGIAEAEAFRIVVGLPEESVPAAGAAIGASESGAGASESGSIETANRLYNEGKYSESLDEYLRAYGPGQSWLDNRIAALSYRSGDYEQALEYWERGLRESGAGSDESGEAARGMVRAGIDRRNGAVLARNVESIVDNLADGGLLAAAGDVVHSDGFADAAAGYYEAAMGSGTLVVGADRIMYKLGQLYENSDALRNERKAHGYYTKLVKEFPASPLWEKARARADYLERHFLRIR